MATKSTYPHTLQSWMWVARKLVQQQKTIWYTSSELAAMGGTLRDINRPDTPLWQTPPIGYMRLRRRRPFDTVAINYEKDTFFVISRQFGAVFPKCQDNYGDIELIWPR